MRIVIGEGSCGIAAGAEKVRQALLNYDLGGAEVSITGCIGMCQYEPIVEVLEPGKEKVTYVKMTAEKAVKVVNDHIVNGNPIVDFTVGAATK